MKQLPEKFVGMNLGNNAWFVPVIESHNQLIDCVAELQELVTEMNRLNEKVVNQLGILSGSKYDTQGVDLIKRYEKITEGVGSDKSYTLQEIRDKFQYWFANHRVHVARYPHDTASDMDFFDWLEQQENS